MTVDRRIGGFSYFTTNRQCNDSQNFKDIVKILKLSKEETNEAMRSKLLEILNY